MTHQSLLPILISLCLVGKAPLHASEDPTASTASSPREISDVVVCEGAYPKHLQGVCTNDRDAIYWSFTVELVKTDLQGNVTKKIPVDDHHGDLCHQDGKIYVAVNLGKFNQPAGEADSWIYVYDAETLEELDRHEVPEVVHGAGGIEFLDGKFLVVGGLPEGIEENYLYEYDASFKFQRRHVLSSGYTRLGIQTAAFAEGHWWFGCYGNPQVLLKADRDYKLVGRWNLDASLGIVGVGGGRLLVAKGSRDGEGGYQGQVAPHKVDNDQGLRPIKTANLEN